LLASLNHCHEIGIGSEGFWMQEIIMGLGLFVEKLSNEKRRYFIASKMHHRQ
jgi:hypothetical protein